MQEEVIHMKLEDDETYEAPEPGEIVDEPEGKPVSGPVLSAPSPSPLPSLEALIKPRQDLVPQQRTFPLPSPAAEQSSRRSERGLCSCSYLGCAVLGVQTNCNTFCSARQDACCLSVRYNWYSLSEFPPQSFAFLISLNIVKFLLFTLSHQCQSQMRQCKGRQCECLYSVQQGQIALMCCMSGAD